MAAHAILAALLKRERTGEGSFVEVPMLESMVGVQPRRAHVRPALRARRSAAPGYPRLLNPYRKPFRTLDGYLCAMPYTDQHWKRFFIEAGEPALADDPRFANISLRTQNIEALYEIAERHHRHAHDGSMAGGVRAARDPRIEDEPARGPAGRRASEGDRLLRNDRGPGHGHG